MQINNLKKATVEMIDENRANLAKAAVVGTAIASAYAYGRHKAKLTFIFQFATEEGVHHLGTQTYTR